jgi:pilus assembly protein Flp/PilA
MDCRLRRQFLPDSEKLQPTDQCPPNPHRLYFRVCPLRPPLGSGQALGNLSEDSMSNSLSHLITDESGVTAIEYGLIAALVAVFIIGAVSNLGTSLTNVFASVAASL